MKVHDERMKEIDNEMKSLVKSMEEAKKNKDKVTYQFLQETYDRYLGMELNIEDSRKNKTGNKLNIAKIIVDFLGVVVTACVGILGITSACKADRDNVIVNQRSWNLGTDFLKRLKR